MLNQVDPHIENTTNSKTIENSNKVEGNLTDSKIEPVIITSEQHKKEKNYYLKPLFITLLLIVFALSTVVLYKKKPTDKDFELWVKKEAAEKRSKTNNMVKKGVSTATQIQILATYRYTDHKIVAIVKASANGKKLDFLGFAGFWVLLP